jgi:hypothetical protein
METHEEKLIRWDNEELAKGNRFEIHYYYGGRWGRGGGWSNFECATATDAIAWIRAHRPRLGCHVKDRKTHEKYDAELNRAGQHVLFTNLIAWLKQRGD